MDASEVTQILTLLVVALAWLWVNLKAAVGWLKILSVVGMLVFLTLASGLTIRAVFW